MEQLNIKAIITATTKKGEKFDGTPNTRKTAYLKVDEENGQKLQDFGLTKYTSKQDGEAFYMVQMTQEVDVYNKYGQVETTLDGGIETPNFDTDKKVVNIAILKGENKGNIFYRLKGIQGEVLEVEPQNLFADTSEDLPF